MVQTTDTNGKTAQGSVTPKGLAVAIVSLSRFVQAQNPALLSHYKDSLRQAESSGLASEDLEFMRLLIKAVDLVRP